ncbi:MULTISPECIES: Crp/Fnr family transcriptional regulator [Olivibacter]|uniref:Crp/Fnr family transcriptional regulator n=2 Tax=Olivibacter TaxID=376469 RepID=A0ABV6HQW1_9SPHI|nr:MULTISPECIES: Crp/Fnr family transcriptional regulator [Olivibacter]MCL4637996.1 Crp/Fnr family transcriptional regulator [Olivibacter sp. UJ_SKK_5.1]MDX3917273.1 Crp/Fnr family transcriptional regulator [Pseudosphingobacterium sp.]QEL03977.1 Crp/Fnr family transcriptional regulator [Olivibacter sp. LS-1]
MRTKPLIDYFENLLPLNEEEKSIVEEAFKERSVKRRHFILQKGDICKHHTFVVEGCFRMYMVDEKGKEYNLQFAIENWWITDIGSFYSEEPSKLYIEALENSTVLQLGKEDQIKLFDDNIKFNRIFRVLTENALISAHRRILQNISSTAEERYLDFLKMSPHFFNRISNVQIASYLGVTPEFLSTIRNKIVKS